MDDNSIAIKKSTKCSIIKQEWITYKHKYTYSILTLSRHQSDKKYRNTSVYQQIELQSHSR